jgi:hypothetical protein
MSIFALFGVLALVLAGAIILDDLLTCSRPRKPGGAP